MLKAPLCLVSLLVALATFPAPAHAMPAAAERLAAPAAEPVRFEARATAKHRTKRHSRRGRGEHCRRCKRRAAAVAYVDRDPRPRARPQPPATPPSKTTITATTDTLGPLRLRLYSSTWVERCEEKHPTFVARTGTYEAGNGKRERCK